MRHEPPHRYRQRTSAARQRRHHRRMVTGRMCVLVEIDDTVVPAELIAAEFLSPADVDNREAIGRAIEKLIEALVAPHASARDP